MTHFIWTFGVDSPWAGKYVVVTSDNDKEDGREKMFEKFGRKNCAFVYPYEKGMNLVEKYGYTLVDEMEA